MNILFVPVAVIAEVNPSVAALNGLSPNLSVFFIPMGDVSEAGEWLVKQTRPLKAVSNGFTVFRENDVLVAKITPCLENGKGAHAKDLLNGIGFGSTEFHVLRARPGSFPAFVRFMGYPSWCLISNRAASRAGAARQTLGSPAGINNAPFGGYRA